MDQIFRRFRGIRNGFDSLALTSIVTALILVIVSAVTRNGIVYLLALPFLFYGVFRIFSNDRAKRAYENEQFVGFFRSVRETFRNAGWKTRAFCTETWRRIRYGRNREEDAAAYRIYSCPGCHQKVRVPRGRGRIEITCPKCGRTFIRKS